jgi:chorismate mutase
MNIIQIRDWGLNVDIPEQEPIIISGPCSAESEEQVLQTALGLSPVGPHILRAGIWKPRTRPNSFEGVGQKGLPWLKLAGRNTGLPVCTEVANPQHVEMALEAGVDVLWIGARTTVNPFSVQAIADALKGVDIPVMIKNPINPDLQLWIGAIERIYNAGITKLAAIHRGFSLYSESPYRNQPLWEIPIELKREIRNIEVICDPSHIAGKRELLLEIAQQALHLDFDGLMIESHINPEVALSDAQQQLTPENLGKMLSKLVKPQAATEDPFLLSRLDKLRKAIDKIDYRFLDLLAERMDLVRQIGDYKKENNIAILQIERWAEIYRSRIAKADDLEVDEAFIKDIINAIHKESIRQQEEIMIKESKENVFKR